MLLKLEKDGSKQRLDDKKWRCWVIDEDLFTSKSQAKSILVAATDLDIEIRKCTYRFGHSSSNRFASSVYLFTYARNTMIAAMNF